MSDELSANQETQSTGAEVDVSPSAAVPRASRTIVLPDEDSEPGNLLPFPVVAIGASAGGLEAYLELLRNLEPDTGMAFIVLPHLAAAHESELPRILSSATNLPVGLMEHGTHPEPNRIYVLPANKRATLRRGMFQLEPRPAERVPLPIDHFMRSLAADQKNRAIGVILSGSDSDGALGLRAIKGEGGIAIVQDPDTARVADMPRSSILADHIDVILPPANIAAELAHIARQFFQPSLQLLEEGGLAPTDEPYFTRLLAMLRTVTGVEFRNYKPGTLRRRTARRMILKRINSLAEYVRYLQENRDELRNLHEDVLINVTRFFRDPQVFAALTTDILPALFEGRPPDQQVRIWIAGCSTGEEAYSIAICLLEYVAHLPHEPPIQIFGTDASDTSIEKARMGCYPESIGRDISPERLRRFFIKTDKGYQISKRVRDVCIFARQNLCNDPPFSRLDLISCRNVLIYLERDTQATIMATFHYGLRPSGYLLLGRSESVTETSELFAPVDRKNKFYARTGQSTPHGLMVIRRASTIELPSFSQPSVPSTRTLSAELELPRVADRVILARHAPPGVVVNRQLEVIEVRGRPSPFISVAPGAASLHLLRMAHPDILTVLRDAVRHSVDSGVPVVQEICVRQEDDAVFATLEVLPLQVGSGVVQYYLILFVPVRRTALPEGTGETVRDTEITSADAAHASRELERLRRDITATRMYLQSLIEERDSRNQELTAAYEEIQSSNEELQSTNEELETAKEELQSTNEELQTVNDELRNRNHALMQASNDLNNLLNSVNVPVVMLGSDLAIRQFTSSAERLMRLRPADVGRPIGEIRLNLQLDELEPILHEVLETLATKEIEVQDRAGRWLLLRVRPYRTSENKIDGLVLLLLDVDQIRRTQDELQIARDFADTVVETIEVPVAVLGGDLRIRTANAAFRVVSGLSTPDLTQRSFSELISILWDWPDLRERLNALLRSPHGTTLQLEHETTRTSKRYFRLVARIIAAGNERAILIVLEDVTAQKEAELLLESDRERLAGQVRSTAEVLGRTRAELRALAARLFTTQEQERRRIARELHDDISQRLAALEIDIEALRQAEPRPPEQLREQLSAIGTRMATLSADVRNLSHQLHPSGLDHLGLSSALRSMVEEFGAREGMVATFRGTNVPEELSPEISSALYRIAQEALRNVARHAGRTHVKVTLDRVNESLRLTIRDLGEGFDTEGEARRGLGLISMEERARLLGGTLNVQSVLGQGTTVTVTVPLTTESHEKT